jgi:tetratricopeptide (TPR) repeat protein
MSGQASKDEKPYWPYDWSATEGRLLPDEIRKQGEFMLYRALNTRSVVAFLGSGLSAAYARESWPDMTRALVNQMLVAMEFIGDGIDHHCDDLFKNLGSVKKLLDNEASPRNIMLALQIGEQIWSALPNTTAGPPLERFSEIFGVLPAYQRFSSGVAIKTAENLQPRLGRRLFQFVIKEQTFDQRAYVRRLLAGQSPSECPSGKWSDWWENQKSDYQGIDKQSGSAWERNQIRSMSIGKYETELLGPRPLDRSEVTASPPKYIELLSCNVAKHLWLALCETLEDYARLWEALSNTLEDPAFKEVANGIAQALPGTGFLPPSQFYLLGLPLQLLRSLGVDATGLGVFINAALKLGGTTVSDGASRAQYIPKDSDPLHIMDTELEIRRFATTNWDLEIERYLSAIGFGQPISRALAHPNTPDFDQVSPLAGRAREIVLGDEHAIELLDFSANESSVTYQLAHLHGRSTAESSLVVTERDYQDFYVRQSPIRTVAREGVDTLFGGNPILFAGLGMSEDDLMRPMRQFLSGDVRRNRSLVALVVPTRSREECAAWAMETFARYGVHVVFAEGEEIELDGEKCSATERTNHNRNELAKWLKDARPDEPFPLVSEVHSILNSLRKRPSFADGVGQLELRVFELATKNSSLGIMSRPKVRAALIEGIGAAQSALMTKALCAKLLVISEKWRSWWKDWRQEPRDRGDQIAYGKLERLLPGEEVRRSFSPIWTRHAVKEVYATPVGDVQNPPSHGFDYFKAATEAISYLTIDRKIPRRVFLVCGERGDGKGHFFTSLLPSQNGGLRDLDWLLPRSTRSDFGEHAYRGAFFASFSFSCEIASIYDALIAFLIAPWGATSPLAQLRDEAHRLGLDVRKLGRSGQLDFALSRLQDQLIEHGERYKEEAAFLRKIESSESAQDHEKALARRRLDCLLHRHDKSNPRLLVALNAVDILMDEDGYPKNAEIRNFFDALLGAQNKSIPLDLILLTQPKRMPVYFRSDEAAQAVKRDRKMHVSSDPSIAGGDDHSWIVLQHDVDPAPPSIVLKGGPNAVAARNTSSARKTAQFATRFGLNVANRKALRISSNAPPTSLVMLDAPGAQDLQSHFFHAIVPHDPATLASHSRLSLLPVVAFACSNRKLSDNDAKVCRVVLHNTQERLHEIARGHRFIYTLLVELAKERVFRWCDGDQAVEELKVDMARFTDRAGHVIGSSQNGVADRAMHFVLQEWFEIDSHGSLGKEITLLEEAVLTHLAVFGVPVEFDVLLKCPEIVRVLENGAWGKREAAAALGSLSYSLYLRAMSSSIMKDQAGDRPSDEKIWDHIRTRQKRERSRIMQAILDRWAWLGRSTLNEPPSAQSELLTKISNRRAQKLWCESRWNWEGGAGNLNGHFTAILEELDESTEQSNEAARTMALHVAVEALVMRGLLFRVAPRRDHPGPYWSSRPDRYSVHRIGQKFIARRLNAQSVGSSESNLFSVSLYASQHRLLPTPSASAYAWTQELVESLTDYPSGPRPWPVGGSNTEGLKSICLRAALGVLRSMFSIGVVLRFSELHGLRRPSIDEQGYLERHRLLLRWILRQAQTMESEYPSGSALRKDANAIFGLNQELRNSHALQSIEDERLEKLVGVLERRKQRLEKLREQIRVPAEIYPPLYGDESQLDKSIENTTKVMGALSEIYIRNASEAISSKDLEGQLSRLREPFRVVMSDLQREIVASRRMGFDAQPFYRDEVMWLYNECAVLSYMQGHLQDAHALFEQALRTARRIEGDGGGPMTNRILLNHAFSELDRGRIAEGRALFSRVTLEASPGDAIIGLIAEGGVLGARRLSADLEEVIPPLERVIKELAAWGRSRAASLFALVHGAALWEVKRAKEAMAAVDKSIEFATQGESADVVMMARVMQTRICASLKDFSNGHWLDEAENYAQAMDAPRILVSVLMARAERQMYIGEVSSAAELAIRALRISTLYGMRLRKLDALELMARINLRRGNTEPARRLHSRAIKAAREIGYLLLVHRAGHGGLGGGGSRAGEVF